MMKIIVIALLLFTLHACHYSCDTCAKDFYNYCEACLENVTMAVVEDPSALDQQWRSSLEVTGVCIGKVEEDINVLGVVMIVWGVMSLSLTRSPELFYLFYTLQNIALVNFIQLAWLPPLSYVLSSLLYFLPFNLMLNQVKATSIDMLKLSHYRLDAYFVESSLLKSLLVLGPLNILIVVLMIVVPCVVILKRKYCGECCRIWLCAEWFLGPAHKVLHVVFFLLIEETMLSIVVALYFSEVVTGWQIVITVVYCIFLIFFLVSSIAYKLTIFPSPINLFHSFLCKVTYPIFLIIGQPYQYVLFVFMLCNFIIQFVFDICNVSYPLKSRMTVYKGFEFATLLLGAVYYIVEVTVNLESSTRVVGIFLLVVICFGYLAMVVESILAGKKILEKKEENKVIPLPEKTLLTIENISGKKTIQELPEYVEKMSEKSEQNECKKQSEKKSTRKQSTAEIIEVKSSQEKEIQEKREQMLIESVVQEEKSKVKVLPEIKRRPRKKDNEEWRSDLKKRYGI